MVSHAPWTDGPVTEEETDEVENLVGRGVGSFTAALNEARAQPSNFHAGPAGGAVDAAGPFGDDADRPEQGTWAGYMPDDP
jgi:hypothetical protein